MKTNLFSMFRNGMAVLLSAGLLFSCSQIETFDTQDLSVAQERMPFAFKSTDANARMHTNMFTCNDVMTPLMAGQNIPVGEVHSYNDNDNLYVHVSIEGDYTQDWFIQKVNMFIGQVELEFQPVGNGKSKANKKGIINPAPGKFPYSSNIETDLSLGVQEYLFTLPIGEGMQEFGEFDIAVHADVVRATGITFEDGVAYGTPVQFEGAWAEGERFNPEGLGNWSMFFSYSVTECEEGDCNPNWSRLVEISGANGNINYIADPEDELEVTYTVNGDNGGRVGEVTLRRTGNASDPKFIAVFTADEDFEFTDLSLCVTDLAGDGEKCVTDFTKVDGVYTLELDNAPFTKLTFETNPNGNIRVLTSGSKVNLSAVSNACE
ncbi:hypothetical protein SAMN06295967_103189 [Belliella buryatensis]|uniref:Uncharacterized protein n=2 Tax=Belliella buryatensis TaxID=1500549 RepID=A0A239BSL9_9BACT|nr:hypothetical protein SAMN06295967_103189 [Belliella buryatensis]